VPLAVDLYESLGMVVLPPQSCFKWFQTPRVRVLFGYKFVSKTISKTVYTLLSCSIDVVSLCYESTEVQNPQHMYENLKPKTVGAQATF